jgi:hypothetical protein
VLDGGPSFAVAIGLPRLHGAAELETRVSARVLRRQAGCDVVGCGELEMRGDLVVELGVEPSAPNERPHPHQKGSHGWLFDSSRNLATMPMARCQSVSAS